MESIRSKRFAVMVVLAALFGSACGVIGASLVQSPLVSAGAGVSANGSIVGLGQAAAGFSVSRFHQMHAGGIPVMKRLLERQPLGDVDADGDLDFDDHALFAQCMNGPEVSVPPRACTQEQFERADLEGDNDVDLADFQNVAALFFVE